ncbi:MAG TPA: serine/threonine-protein kinase [Terriglobales bacterium]|nr:serine/threonine-protein kinase [Terriglobales bacterium]
MNKFKFAWADVAIGAVVSIVMFAVFYMNLADGLEAKLYDVRAKMRAKGKAGDKVVLVTIDDKSVQELGRWPWPRNYMAEMVDQLTEAGAETIGVAVGMPQPELNPGLVKIQDLAKSFEAEAAAVKPTMNSRMAAAKAQEFADILKKSAAELDNDEKLAGSIAFSSKVVLPMYFTPGQGMGKSSKPIPEEVEKNFVANLKADAEIFPVKDFTPPYEKFAKDAKAIGTMNSSPAADSVNRAFPLVVNYEGRLFPSFPLQVLRSFYKLESNDFRYSPGELVLGNAKIPVDAEGRMLVDYIDRESFPRFYFADVRNKKVPNEAFTGKIVLIGVDATGGGDSQATPVGSVSGFEIHGNVIQGILNGSYIVRPTWAAKAEIALLVIFALFVSLAIPHISAGKSAIASAVLLIATVGAGIYFFTASGYWLKVIYPCLMLVVGYTVVVSKRYLVQEKRTEVLEGESVETNKMLGLSFQGQGMLDMAFEKFRKVPIDEGMKDTLYNLALDFERKRQLNKAVSVYDHIMSVDKKFKDVSTRAEKLRAAGETMIFGGALGARKGSPDSTVMVGGGVGDLAKPQLGRYEVLKELGKGAMGIVYLGKDPKINREVAIKTLRFEDEFEAEDMKAMKERFFREAESAGRLVHPNIVTIYDAGDDGDISYIAMELLSGTDLKEFVTKEKLLPANEVTEIIAKVADALDYAHSEGVVHRDIKPANIMRLNDGKIKVADFGIARITSQSKTATGTVMGTPSYMAPEQLAGKRVDGRADLFSLGVTLYELLTGEKPFTGESVATLMFRIANEPHLPILSCRADLPPHVQAVIDKALAKNPDTRYARGSEMARDLRAAGVKAAEAGA